MELKFEFGLWIKTILILGSEFLLMERSNTWSIQIKTTQKSLQIHKKSEYHKEAQVWLQQCQRQNQNLNREYSLGQQQPYQYLKEDGLTVSHQNKILLRTIFRRKWSIFFDTIKRYSEKTMEQLKSTKSNSIFDIIIHKYKFVWWSLESLFGSRRRFEKEISVLLWWFGRNSLPPCSSRTFWSQSHWSYVTGQCGVWDWNIPLHLPHRMCIQSSFYYQQWIDTWRLKFEQKTDSILLAHWSKRRNHVERDTCTKHGKGTRTRYSGLILILLSEKD